MTNLVRAEARISAFSANDRVYQGFSVAFDASVEEIWLAFFAGATLVVGSSEMQHAGPALSRLLREAGVTVLSCVPTLLAMMEDDVPDLRLLILGGEQCPQNLVERWCRPGRRMVNTYGPTEATVIATFGDCAPGKPVTIGRPVPNYHAYILDDNLRPVAAGSSGELYLGRNRVWRGVTSGLPEVTRAKFVTNPFTSHGGYPSRLYKTGDLARFTPTGEIEFLGRADSQVKLRGFRIELTEIENVLLECPGVSGCGRYAANRQPGDRAVSGLSRAGRQPRSTRNRSALICARGCRFSWCRPCWKRSKCCRRWPAAKSTARHCPRRARRRQNELARGSLPATNLRPRSPRSGNRCSCRREFPSTTISSSTWAGIRF